MLNVLSVIFTVHNGGLSFMIYKFLEIYYVELSSTAQLFGVGVEYGWLGEWMWCKVGR